jgi:predicted AlkP superfamily pyrophosphatase or phosphodiesterase
MRIPRRSARLLGTLLSVPILVTHGCSRGAPETAVDAGSTTPAGLDAPYVVLLSLDGFRHDYLDRYPTPALQRMAREGVRAERMIPAFPTKTFPTHFTIATGLHAENHGLVGNRFWAPDKGATYEVGERAVVEDGSWYRGEPIWVTAERQGMRTASYFFVGSEADVGGVRPTYWKRYDGSVPNAARVDTVLSWLALPDAQRPHMITLYFSDLDDVGHEFGPESPEVGAAVAAVDEQIGRLLDGVAALPHGDSVYVIVVSDHGMLRAEAARAQPLDLSGLAGVRMVESGPYASLFVDDGGPARLPGVRDSLQAMLPEADVWLRAEVPERFHYRADPRIGDILILARPGATVLPSGWMPARDGYTHGWDNETPEMGAIFLAVGPRIAPGQSVGAFESVHVYPLLAHLLGLDPAPADGRLDVLAPILRP